MARFQETPNEVKVTGFINMLHDEWTKSNCDRDLDPKFESSRYLNLMYTKVVRDGPGHDDETEEKPVPWTPESKMLLLKVGQAVEAVLQNPTTPDDLRMEGFSSLLLAEWRKQEHGAGSESMRSLTMMYNRLKREGLKAEAVAEDSETGEILATWTPKHNRVLVDCMHKFSGLADAGGVSAFRQNVIKSWRAKFSKSSISDALLVRKINDLSFVPDRVKVKLESDAADFADVKFEPAVAAPEPGDMQWSPSAIQNLFECHREAKRELAKLLPRSRPQLSALLHARFLKAHPDCKLAPSILLAKHFSLKTSGDHQLPAAKLEAPAPSSALPAAPVAREAAVESEPSKKSKNLVFRTWTQAMIDDMMSTRKVALVKKKRRLEADPADALPLAEIWYEEFLKLHPDYRSTKKNLWRKYKWYKSRMGQDKIEASPKKAEVKKETVVNRSEEQVQKVDIKWF
jgi:hypothetical protein